MLTIVLFQNFLIVVIVVAIINYIVGALIGPSSDVERAKGFVGINCKYLSQFNKPKTVIRVFI